MTKHIHNRPKNAQAFYYAIIMTTAGLLVWEKAKPDKEERLWFLLLGLFVMIWAYFKATRNWAYDNPKPKPGEEEQSGKPEYEIKNPDIPDLTTLADNLEKKSTDSP